MSLIQSSITRASFRVTLVSLVLLPTLRIPGLPGIRVDDFVPIVWLLMVAPFCGNFLSKASSLRALLLAVLFALFSLSIVNGVMHGYGGSAGDANQYVRLGKYLGTYLLACAYFGDSSNHERDLVAFAALVVPLFLIALWQYFDWFGFNEHYVRLIAPTQYESLINGYANPRPVAMVGNPNELAYLFVLLAIVSVYLITVHRSFWGGIFCLISICGVVLTLSRSGIVALIAGTLCVAFLHMTSGGRRRFIWSAVFTILGGFAVWSILSYGPIYDQFTWRLAKIAALATDNSWSQRLSNWQENIAIVAQHPLLGVGPLRRVVFEHSSDNEWLLIMRSYGAVGTAAIAGLLIMPIFAETTQRRMLGIALAVSGVVYMLPAALFHSLVLFPIFLIAMAYCDQCSRPIDKE